MGRRPAGCHGFTPTLIVPALCVGAIQTWGARTLWRSDLPGPYRSSVSALEGAACSSS